jgi:hypothetical protein
MAMCLPPPSPESTGVGYRAHVIRSWQHGVLKEKKAAGLRACSTAALAKKWTEGGQPTARQRVPFGRSQLPSPSPMITRVQITDPSYSQCPPSRRAPKSHRPGQASRFDGNGVVSQRDVGRPDIARPWWAAGGLDGGGLGSPGWRDRRCRQRVVSDPTEPACAGNMAVLGDGTGRGTSARVSVGAETRNGGTGGGLSPRKGDFSQRRGAGDGARPGAMVERRAAAPLPITRRACCGWRRRRSLP